MVKILGMIVCVLCMTLGASAVEYPQFRSAVSTTGITANFDSLYSQTDKLLMVYDVVDHDEGSIVWKWKDTGIWGILKDDGTVAIASTSAFSLDVKDVLNADLVRAKNLVEASGGTFSDAPLVYYVDDPHLYRLIKYNFDSNFNLNLFTPNCTVEEAILSVSGSDYAQTDTSLYGHYEVLTPGQHYWIDGKEVSGCDAARCEYKSLGPGGISCVPQDCEYMYGADNSISVRVAPVYITDKIAPGIHSLAAKGINNRHTIKIEAVTSISDDEMLLYSDDLTVMITETRSSPMAALYDMIEPNEQVDNTTIDTPATNSTL